MDKRLLSCCLVAAGLFFGACGTEGDWACTTNDDCVEGYLCPEEGACAPLDPVRIVTESLPRATLEAEYRFTLEAADGVPPYDWSLERQPDWMSVDPETGVLSGVPDRPATGLMVRVQVRDSTSGRDSWAEALLFVDVNHCSEGQTVVCYQADGDRCFAGTKLCSGGDWGDCGQMEPSSSREHCGPYCEPCVRRSSDGCFQGACACGEASACTGGDACCNAACVDPATDLKNCGDCGIDCTGLLQNVADPRCREGACTFDQCQGDFLNCNQDPTDGCETPMDVRNCGACNHNCDGLVQNATDVRCKLTPQGRRCDYLEDPANGKGCRFGFYDCDGDRENGCETPVSRENCGACGDACADSTCRLHPDGNRHYCGCQNDADCGTGRQCCEGYCFDRYDPAHCGSCTNDCTRQVANATVIRCDHGSCGYDACLPGFLDCDGNRPNGCEKPMDDDNCGACGFSCGANASCVDGSCACVADRGNCDGDWESGCEVNLTFSVEHCGGCGNDCRVQVQQATGVYCSSGRCNYSRCEAGWGSCDGQRENGCEIDLQNDDANCGACGTVCEAQNGSNHCAAGACQPICDAGWDNCHGHPEEGCETNLIDNLLHCGACGNECTGVTVVNTQDSYCAHDKCDYLSCRLGSGDCDLDRTNGCETNITSSVGHCGSCATDCNIQVKHASSITCTNSLCDYGSCNSGWDDCDRDRSNGCETDLRWDPDNCGQCGKRCVAPKDMCTNGTCGSPL